MKKSFTVLFLLIFLSACKTTEPTYFYGGYQKVVYSYFKGDEVSLAEQINALEQIIQLAKAESKSVAPGLHAHLGMLYFESGDANQGLTHLKKEQELFPESQQYIEFLIESSSNGDDA